MNMINGCTNCHRDMCSHLGLKCDDIPALNPKLRHLFEWKHKMCSKVEMEYYHGATICKLEDTIINVKGSWDVGYKGCPYG